MYKKIYLFIHIWLVISTLFLYNDLNLLWELIRIH